MTTTPTSVRRIDKLTDEQKAAMATWAAEWTERSLNCDPADRATFERAAADCCRYAGLPWHANVVWVGNPLVVAIAGPVAEELLRGRRSRPVHGAVRGAVHDAVHGAVQGAVRGAVDGAVRGAVHGAVDDAVHGAVHGAVHDAVHDAVRGAVDGAVRGAVDGAVRGAVHGAVHGAVKNCWWRYLGGQWWLGWQAYTAFLRDVCALELPGDLWDRDRAYADAQASAGWWWPHRDFIIVSDRPAEIHREQVAPSGWGSHRLHRADGPAIRWRDGFALHFWHGRQVPADLIEGDGWSVERIISEANAEIRRCAIERLGWDRFIAHAALTPVDVQPDPGNPGQVLRLFDLPERLNPYEVRVRVLVCVNATPERDGTLRQFGLTVPADVPDAIAAASWTFRVDPGVYRQLARAT